MEPALFVTAEMKAIVEFCISDEQYPIACVILVKMKDDPHILQSYVAIPDKSPSALVLTAHYIKQQKLLQTPEYDQMLRYAHKERETHFEYASQEDRVDHLSSWESANDTLVKLFEKQVDLSIEYMLAILEIPPELKEDLALFQETKQCVNIYESITENNDVLPICKSLLNIFTQ